MLGHSALAVDIEIRALFGGAAMIAIDGKSQLLKVGERSVEGIELVSADAEKAVVEYKGEKLTITLSDRIASSFTQADQATVMINMNKNRQYFTAGSINGRSVQFLVDTGANVVSLDSGMAASLGISLADGEKSWATTAGGPTQVTLVNLPDVQVGPISQHNVKAVVSHASHPPYVLLGMSFLQHVDISEKAGLMVLTSKL